MRSTKQFTAVLGLLVLALSLPVVAQSTAPSNAAQDTPAATSQTTTTTTTTQGSNVPAPVAPAAIAPPDTTVPAAMAEGTAALITTLP
jgi:ABC-type phosphate transport system substrate-binding protein